MKRLACVVACALAVPASAALFARTAGADEQDPSIEKIMQSLFKGKTAAAGVLKTQLKSASPSWDKVKESTGTFAKLAPSLHKNDPPKGDKAHFEELARAFAVNAKALDDSAREEDLTATKAAFRKIGASCKSCHGAHRE